MLSSNYYDILVTALQRTFASSKVKQIRRYLLVENALHDKYKDTLKMNVFQVHFILLRSSNLTKQIATKYKVTRFVIDSVCILVFK